LSLPCSYTCRNRSHNLLLRPTVPFSRVPWYVLVFLQQGIQQLLPVGFHLFADEQMVDHALVKKVDEAAQVRLAVPLLHFAI